MSDLRIAYDGHQPADNEKPAVLLTHGIESLPVEILGRQLEADVVMMRRYLPVRVSDWIILRVLLGRQRV